MKPDSVKITRVLLLNYTSYSVKSKIDYNKNDVMLRTCSTFLRKKGGVRSTPLT